MSERRVRNFRLVREIGTGGMGTIWRAIQEPLERPVALKELHPHLAKDPDFLRRFEREAQAAAAIHHENVVSVIDFGREGDACFLALELVDGPDLSTVLGSSAGASDVERRVPLPIALSIATDILRGLATAHARGVVHRDIKPANVLLSKEGVAKIADFSVALVQASGSLTTTGTTLGTPAYMSPEQAGGGRALDARSDLFSVGVLLWEMLAGAKPFDGDTYAAIVGRVLTYEPRDLDQVDRLVPARVSRAVRRALEKDAQRRWASADELRRELEDAARDAGIPVSRAQVAEWIVNAPGFQREFRRRQAITHDEVTPLPMPAARRGSRTPLAIAAAIGGVALIAYAVVSSLPEEGTATPTSTPVAAATSAPVSPAATPSPAGTSTPAATRALVRATAAATAAPASTPATPVPTPTAVAAAANPDLAVVDPQEQSIGWLKLIVKPWAKVYVDARYVGDTPFASPLKLDKGKHTVTLEHPEYPPLEEEIEIVPGAILTRRVTLAR